LVYQVKDDRILFAQARYHYSNLQSPISLHHEKSLRLRML
jgi:hypothetical protein